MESEKIELSEKEGINLPKREKERERGIPEHPSVEVTKINSKVNLLSSGE